MAGACAAGGSLAVMASRRGRPASLRRGIGAAALALPVLALAGPEVSSQEPVVVVVGTRLPTTLRDGSDSLSLVSRAQIDRMGVASAVDLLRLLPGLQIDQVGGPGGLSSIYIRGSDPNHVLVLIDGLRVNDPTNSRGGSFDMSSLDPALIERIEVLRGGASSIYGADAMGGVINIVTRQSESGSAGGLGWGGLGYRSVNARASQRSDDVAISAVASTLRDGIEAGGSTLALRQIAAAAGLAISPVAKLQLDFKHSERDSTSFPDDSGGILLAQIRTPEQRHARDSSIRLGATWAFDLLSLSATATALAHSEDIDSPGVAPGVRSAFGLPASLSQAELRRANALVHGVMHLAQGRALAAGVELQREHGINRSSYALFGRKVPAEFDLRRDTRAGFIELKWPLRPDGVLRLGLRRDWIQDNGARTSPSLGLRYQLPAWGGAVKAAYSAGFKPPSFFALGLPIALGGNPGLRPETSRGGSVGYEQSGWNDKASAAVAAFQTNYAHLVTFDNQTNRLVNADRVRSRGVETELNLRATESMHMRAVFTRLLSHVANSDEPLRQRPGRRAGVEVDWRITAGSNLNWRVEYAADSFDSSVPTGAVMLPATLRSDMAYSVRVQAWLRLGAAVDNLLDRQNQSYIGAIGQQRRLRLTANVAL